jgi:hypothetical protein
MAQPDAGAASLNSGEVALVLAHLAGDVQSLCAVACVSRAWRAAAADPALWCRLECLPRDVAHRLNAERLAGLVARSAGGLQLLDLSDAGRLTDADLEVALCQPHALTSFTADSECERLTAAGVVAALASRRGLIVELRVAGLAVGPELPSDFSDDEGEREGAVIAFANASVAVIAALRALMAPGGVLDGEFLCDGEAGEICVFLCGEDDTCGHCARKRCLGHGGDEFEVCNACDGSFCDYCIEGDFCGASVHTGCCCQVTRRRAHG